MKISKKDAALFKDGLEVAAALIANVSVSLGMIQQAKIRGMLCSCLAIIDKVIDEFRNETIRDCE